MDANKYTDELTNRNPDCQSEHTGHCYGTLWTCEACHKTLCCASGQDDDHPELCDECWAKKHNAEEGYSADYDEGYHAGYGDGQRDAGNGYWVGSRALGAELPTTQNIDTIHEWALVMNKIYETGRTKGATKGFDAGMVWQKLLRPINENEEALVMNEGFDMGFLAGRMEGFDSGVSWRQSLPFSDDDDESMRRWLLAEFPEWSDDWTPVVQSEWLMAWRIAWKGAEG